MKKILLLISTTALLASTTMAGPAGTAYIKAAGGVNKMDKLKVSTSFGDIKHKSKTIGFAEVSVGYNALDNARLDLTYSHFFNPTFSKSFNGDTEINGRPIKIDVKSKIKLNLDTIMVNGYVDLYDAGFAKFFVGGGLGIALVKSKSHVSGTATKLTNGSTKSLEDSSSSKRVTRFAYSGTVGVSGEVAPAVDLEVAFSYRGVLLNKVDNDAGLANKSLNSYNGTVGIRYNF